MEIDAAPGITIRVYADRAVTTATTTRFAREIAVGVRACAFLIESQNTRTTGCVHGQKNAKIAQRRGLSKTTSVIASRFAFHCVDTVPIQDYDNWKIICIMQHAAYTNISEKLCYVPLIINTSFCNQWLYVLPLPSVYSLSHVSTVVDFLLEEKQIFFF